MAIQNLASRGSLSSPSKVLTETTPAGHQLGAGSPCAPLPGLGRHPHPPFSRLRAATRGDRLVGHDSMPQWRGRAKRTHLVHQPPDVLEYEAAVSVALQIHYTGRRPEFRQRMWGPKWAGTSR